MYKFLLLALGAVAFSPMASATTVSCTVTSGSVLVATGGGLIYSIANGVGTSSGGATGTINCPAISTGSGFINNYQVLGIVDYSGGPAGTTSGTSVTEVLTLVGGLLNGASQSAIISGGTNPSGVVPATPFQIGSTLSGLTVIPGFNVTVDSSVTLGGPVAASSGQIVISYQVGALPAGVPEPSTYALMTAGLAGIGLLARRRRLS